MGHSVYFLLLYVLRLGVKKNFVEQKKKSNVFWCTFRGAGNLKFEP